MQKPDAVDEIAFLKAAIGAALGQRNAALDGHVQAEANLAVLKGKLDEANKRIAELTPEEPKEE